MFKRWFRRQAKEQGLHLPGSLWLDDPGAQKEIDRRARRGELTPLQQEKLHGWVDNGYMIVAIDLPEEWTERLEREVDTLWSDRPDNALYAFDTFLKRFRHADPQRERRSPYRITELHGASEIARRLYLNRQLFEWVDLILGEPAVATQSIYFEFGSQQGLHRDPVFVQMTPASHLVACWIALEDIRPGSGELIYVPGSHRLPYYEFAPGRWVYDFFADGQAKMEAMQQFDEKNRSDKGLQVEKFLPRRGEALLWHASLMHGGSVVTEPSLTRRSFVVHYTSLANHSSHSQLIVEPVTGPEGVLVEEQKIYTTSRVLEENGCHGFDSPINE